MPFGLRRATSTRPSYPAPAQPPILVRRRAKYSRIISCQPRALVAPLKLNSTYSYDANLLKLWRATQSAANPSLERGSLLSAKVAKEKQPIFYNLAGIRLISAVISFLSELGCRVFTAALQGIDPSLGRKLNSDLLRISGGGSARRCFSIIIKLVSAHGCLRERACRRRIKNT